MLDVDCQRTRRVASAANWLGAKKSKCCGRDLGGVQSLVLSSLRFWGQDCVEGDTQSSPEKSVAPSGLLGLWLGFFIKHAASAALRINAKHIFRERERRISQQPVLASIRALTFSLNSTRRR